MRVRIKKDEHSEPKGLFEIKGARRPYPRGIRGKMKDWFWRAWMNIFGVVLVPNSCCNVNSVRVHGKVSDLKKVKFVRGPCILASSPKLYALELRNYERGLKEGLKYTIDFGDPVRLFDLVYIRKVSAGKDDSDGHLIDVSYLFKVGDAQVSIDDMCPVRIISVSI